MSVPRLLLLLLLLSRVSSTAQVAITELAANPSERIVKWSAAGVPSIGSGTPWLASAFDHSGWNNGTQPFGHGEAGLSTDLTGTMSGKAYTLYVRKEFTASALQAASAALLRLQIDYTDGFVAYINGVEITRKNMGAANHFAYALQRAYNPAATSGVSDIATIAANQVLVTGTNVLAIEVHNYDLDTSVKLDAALSITGGDTLISSGVAGGTWRYFVGVHEPSGIVVDTRLVTQPFPPPAGKSEDYEDPYEARDWLELHNTGGTPFDLTGYSLTDNPAAPAKWVFPPGSSIAAGGFLIVMCDHRFEANGATADLLHANFKLEADGGSITLFNGGTQIDSITYPGGQNAHATFGRSSVDGTSLVFMENATPGAANSGTEHSARTAAPTAGLPGGFYDTAQTITLACSTAGATIRYTLDGSDPTDTSTVYSTPLTISFLNEKTGRVLRARAFATDLLPSAITTHTYLIAQHAALKTLPAMLMTSTAGRVFYKPHGVMSIEGGSYDASSKWIPGNTETYNIPLLRGDTSEREIALEYHYPDTTTGFSVQAGMRLSASKYTRPRLKLQNTSDSPWRWDQWEEKPSFNLYFRGAYGPGKLNHAVFPGYDITRFDKLRLRSGKNDNFNPHITDELCRRIHMAMGHEGVIGNWCNLYVNGQFKGYYNLVERIREDMLREHYGGSAVWDIIDNNEVEDGDRVAFDELFDITLAADLTVPANWEAAKQKLDLDNVCDYFLMKIYTAMWDWPNNNWVMVREQSTGSNAVWRFIDWDSEGGFNAIGYTGQNVDFDMIGNLFANSDNLMPELFNRLRTSAEFRLHFADRVQKHMFNGGVLDDRGGTSWLKTQKDVLRDQVQPILTYVTGQAFNESWFNTWTAAGTGRRSYLLGPNGTQLASYGLWPATAAPTLSIQGGIVTQGTALTLTGSGGTLYYTDDGSDPRLEGGSVAPTATAYSSAIILNENRTIRARLLSTGGEWSPLSEASFIIDPVAPTATNLIIAEFMYNPPSATLAETQAPDPITDGDDFEYVRLQNVGTAPVLLSQVTLTGGITYAFSGSGISNLAPGQSVLVVKSLLAFQKRYGSANGVLIAAGSYGGRLSNGGETLELRENDILLHSVTYDDSPPWPIVADDYGSSLLLRDPFTAPDHSLVTNWIASAGAGGQPGGIPHLTNWTAWRDLCFHRTEDPADIKDLDDDPDRDGIPNALEFILGTSPKLRDDPGVLPTAGIVTVGLESYLCLDTRLSTSVSEAVIAVETSSVLTPLSWQSGPANTSELGTATNHQNGTRSTSTCGLTPINGAVGQYMRLKVIVP